MSSLSRRSLLRGFGATLALPFLESLAPSRVRAAAAAVSSSPLRMAYIYIPNGVNVEHWTSTGEGRDYNLSRTLQPLKNLKNDFSVLSGLECQPATNGGDGAGDHARANGTFLTGVRLKKTAGADIQAGISVDQIAANVVGKETRLSSLELSTDGVRRSGHCDSGYSCAYQFNLAWKGPSTPMVPEMDPRLVFERMFGNGNAKEQAESLARRRQANRSILDFVLEDAKSLSHQLPTSDRHKLDEYMTAVRETEQRIQKAEKFNAIEMPDLKSPDGIPATYGEHIRAMFDLMVLAFQTDTTRISTFLLAHDGSNRSFPEIGVTDGHHGISHHQKDPEKLEKIAKIDAFYTTQLAYFLQKMKDTKDGDGSLLDHSMIVYGAGIGDGDRHNHDDLPILLAGGGNGTLKPGRRVVFKEKTPLSNLHVSMLHRMGVKQERFGDSSGMLSEI